MENKKTLLKNAEFYLVLMMYAFCGALAWQISKIDITESRMLPIVALVISVASASINLFQLVRGNGGFVQLKDVCLNRKELAVFLLLLIANVLYEILGFYTTIFLFSLGVMGVLEMPLNRDKAVKGLVYISVMMGLIYLCFSIILGMVTPAGLFI